MSGPLWFVPVAQWSPPLGWWTWIGVVLAAAALLGVTGLVSRPESPSHTLRADVEAPAATD
jgi:hypothetical protein